MAFDRSARELLAESCRIIAHAGLAEDVLGHVSMRTDAGIAIRCRGPQESGLLFTEPEDIHEVVAQHPLTGGYKAPNELPIHAEVLAARPDVQAVVHAHAPAVIAADLAGVELRAAVGAYNIPAMRMAAEGIPTYPRSLLINTTELGQEVASSLGGAPALVLRGHGIVTVGATVEQAVVRALNVEILARMLVAANALGTVSYEVPEADMAMMPDLGSGFNDGFVWNYHRARLRHAGLALH
ncbi:class II aldolase/adducin family protein [Pseudarthrobacter enclensis]|uniref:Ribulose-5-phosphate 4-epimerase/fuculose-1-phosphate aldolase n=1 Tax=Pseudarthrobacter enclensis TaxID=993070 RepID=A0ABT9RWL0_9MICC|nr:class II aldolase/adducin family protein [Pseudarthrobacter enclensis]MDP9888689.1 ribulose-5-phosphate 4-epimerase/fuculose-1-phosphate aldolase [Pseudarthrobacter enclensis]